MPFFFFQFSFFSIPSVGEEWIFYETNFGNLKVEGNRGADLEGPRGLQPPFSLIFKAFSKPKTPINLSLLIGVT